MGSLTTYLPTSELTSADRTQLGFFNAYKSWAMENEVLSNFFTITSDAENYKIVLTPKATNLTYFALTLTIAPTNVNMSSRWDGTYSTLISANHSGYTNDVPITLVYDDNNLIFKLDSDINYYCLFKGTSFDGTASGTAMMCLDNSYNNLNICYDNGTSYVYKLAKTSYLGRWCGGKTATYLVTKSPIPGTNLMSDKLYYFDGGLADIPSGIFKIGSKTYFTVSSNVAFLMD